MSSANLSQGISLRPLRVSDAAALAVLHAACLPPGWSEASMAATLADDTVQGEAVFRGDMLIAFLLYRLLPDAGEILTLAVDVRERRQGWARLLLSCMEAHTENMPLWLEVQADNEAAQALYSGLGYVADGLRKAYYVTPTGRVDAVLMRKTPASPSSR